MAAIGPNEARLLVQANVVRSVTEGDPAFGRVVAVLRSRAIIFPNILCRQISMSASMTNTPQLGRPGLSLELLTLQVMHQPLSLLHKPRVEIRHQRKSEGTEL